MKFELKRDSWHYRLANFASEDGNRRVYRDSDICTYIRALMLGAFWFLVCLWFVALAGIWVGTTVYNLYTFAVYGSALTAPAIVLCCLIITLALIVVIAVQVERYKERKHQRRMEILRQGGEVPEPKPGFIRLAYRKFKDKTCFKLEFK